MALDAPVRQLFDEDDTGHLHFRPELVNAVALDEFLERLEVDRAHRSVIHEVYEQVFSHHQFTGRSGSMYGYEGLGSIYWHMVAKLLLAVQEAYWSAIDEDQSDVDRLAAAYRRIRAGLGFQKDPLTYGAIPTDCYSHTPMHAGAQQPGMTGQVKEEVLTRLGELGIPGARWSRDDVTGPAAARHAVPGRSRWLVRARHVQCLCGSDDPRSGPGGLGDDRACGRHERGAHRVGAHGGSIERTVRESRNDRADRLDHRHLTVEMTARPAGVRSW